MTTPRRRKADPGLVDRREILDEAGIDQALRRIAGSIAARNPELAGVVLVGIRTGGDLLAARLHAILRETTQVDVPRGVVDITLYRDDVFEGLPRPEVGATQIPVPVEGRTLVVVDDVLFTGRTIRSALDALMDFGRPRRVQLAVLVDRGQRELPIQADYVGVSVDTTARESIRVYFREEGDRDRVVLRERQS